MAASWVNITNRIVLVIRAILALGIGIPPIVGNKLQAVPKVWPPVGSLSLEADAAAGVIAMFGLLPFLIKTKKRSKICAVAGLVATLVALTVYGYLLSRYVVSVPTREAGIQYRTIGSERSEECFRKLPDKTNQEILEIAGLTEGDIERMWTPSSVHRCCLELFLTYVALFCFLNFTIGSLGPFLKIKVPRTFKEV